MLSLYAKIHVTLNLFQARPSEEISKFHRLFQHFSERMMMWQFSIEGEKRKEACAHAVKTKKKE